MIKGFFVISSDGLTAISSIIDPDIKVNEQLIGGMISALDSFAAEVTGSGIQVFHAGPREFHIKKMAPECKFVVITSVGENPVYIERLIETLNVHFIQFDAYSRFNNFSERLPEDSQVMQAIKEELHRANEVSERKDTISREGQIVRVFLDFPKDRVIALWRGILAKKRFIMTSASAEKIRRYVNSLLLLHPRDTDYAVFPEIDVKDARALEVHDNYIAGTTSSFILKMRKDLWDIHLDLDKCTVASQEPCLPVEEFERDLFEDVFAMTQLDTPNESILRELISNANTQLTTVLKLLKNQASKVKPVLKKYKISKQYYREFLTRLDLV